MLIETYENGDFCDPIWKLRKSKVRLICGETLLGILDV